MLMNITIFLYVFITMLFATMIVYGKLFVFKKRKPQYVSDYCATMAGILGVYVLLSLILAGLFTYTQTKIIMLGFAVSPFIIGLFAKYHTEKYFTLLQLALLITSALYVVL